MFEYLAKRLAQIVPTLVFVSMLIFGLQQLLPGDPAKVLAGEEQDPSVIAHLRQKLHLDEPLPIRYAYWVGGVLKGDLGESVRTQRDPAERKKTYEQIAARVLKERPIIYVYHRNWLWAYNPKLTGVRNVPDGLLRVTGLKMGNGSP